MKSSMKYAIGAAAVLTAASAQPAAAQALPDLVVNIERSEILSLSCSTNEPLAVIRVAIDNIGDGSASRATTVGLPAVAGVSAEHAPYTYMQVDSRTNIDPGEISTEVVVIGDGIVKAGRIGDVSTTRVERDTVQIARSLTEQRRLPFALRRQIQERLQTAGYYSADVDGIFGSQTEAAIRAYQRARGDAQTGVLTVAQIDSLLRGGPSRSDLLATGGGEQRVRFIVIVDPTNIITESDESNNVWITPPQTLSNC